LLFLRVVAICLAASLVSPQFASAQQQSSKKASVGKQKSAKPTQASGTAEPSEQPSQKYREIFFPKGMPAEEDPETGEKKSTQYAFYDEADLGESRLAVLFSKNIPNPGNDANYTVTLGVLSRTGSSWQVSQLTDLTESMPVQTEGPGNFYRMDGKLEPVNISAKIKGLHVNLWAVLAGSGSVSGATDLIFKAAGGKLEKMLELKDTSRYSRLGASQSTISNSNIFMGDLDGDGNAEIVVEKSTVEEVQGKRTVNAESPVVYKLSGLLYQPSAPIEKSALEAHKADLKKLVRSRFIRVVTPGDAAAGTKN
jgi:hypothetical protein